MSKPSKGDQVGNIMEKWTRNQAKYGSNDAARYSGFAANQRLKRAGYGPGTSNQKSDAQAARRSATTQTVARKLASGGNSNSKQKSSGNSTSARKTVSSVSSARRSGK